MADQNESAKERTTLGLWQGLGITIIRKKNVCFLLSCRNDNRIIHETKLKNQKIWKIYKEEKAKACSSKS